MIYKSFHKWLKNSLAYHLISLKYLDSMIKLVWFKTIVRYILLCYDTILKKASHKYLYHLLSVYSEHNGSFQLTDRCVNLLGSSC